MPFLAGRRAAVIGGTGFLGSHLVERLVAEGADVLAVARTPTRIRRLSAVRADCTVALADVCHAPSIAGALRRFRPDVVFHLAAHADGAESFGHFAECVRVNGLGLVNALQAAAEGGAELFVYGDSAKDYGNASVPYRAMQPAQPICSYAIVKSAGWQLCQLAASFTPLKTVALRPTFVYGPRQNRNVISHVRECVSAGRPVTLMGGTQTRDPLYVDDAVDAFVAAAQKPRAWGQAIPIGGGQELTVVSLCEAVLAALGAAGQIVAGAEESRLTEIWRSNSDNVDAYNLLEWQPRVTLSEGLARTVSGWACDDASTPSVTVRPRRGCYLSAVAPGVVFRMLDRREIADRRAVPRGGRRAGDVEPTEHVRPRLVQGAAQPASLRIVMPAHGEHV
jgi:UDP-glucose 4-epimerase